MNSLEEPGSLLHHWTPGSKGRGGCDKRTPVVLLQSASGMRSSLAKSFPELPLCPIKNHSRWQQRAPPFSTQDGTETLWRALEPVFDSTLVALVEFALATLVEPSVSLGSLSLSLGTRGYSIAYQKKNLEASQKVNRYSALTIANRNGSTWACRILALPEILLKKRAF